MHRGPSPPGVNLLCTSNSTLAEGPIYLEITHKILIMAYRQMHIHLMKLIQYLDTFS